MPIRRKTLSTKSGKIPAIEKEERREKILDITLVFFIGLFCLLIGLTLGYFWWVWTWLFDFLGAVTELSESI